VGICCNLTNVIVFIIANFIFMIARGPPKGCELISWDNKRVRNDRVPPPPPQWGNSVKCGKPCETGWQLRRRLKSSRNAWTRSERVAGSFDMSRCASAACVSVTCRGKIYTVTKFEAMLPFFPRSERIPGQLCLFRKFVLEMES